VLGLADANFYMRAKAPPGGAKSREKQRKIPRAIETKESGRWVEGLVQADRRLREAAMVSVIADRESDIYELFARPRAPHVHLIVRAAHDRRMSDGAKLMAALAAGAHEAGEEIFIAAKRRRAARKARTRVRWRKVVFPRPRIGFELERLPASVELTALMVEEIDAPEGEAPIVWVLLTTHAVESLEDALRIVGWYRARWTVEQVFRVMKSQGFDIEDSQIETPEAMKKLALSVLIAALRVMQLVNARTGATDQKLSDAMDEAAEPLVERLTAKLEGATLRQKNPHPKGTLARLSWVVARLGGWDGYVGRSYKPPGPITMARGLTKFDAFREGWALRELL
jgi:hypothetical protein